MIDIAASLEATSRQHACGCVKTTEDLARYRRVIEASKPEIIVECGTFSGKSAVWFARIAACPVITIDVTPYVDPDIRLVMNTLDVTEFVGSSTDPHIVRDVWALAARKRAMVVLDSDHSADHVLAEMKAYAGLVRPGGYMVVEDTLLRHMPAEERKHYRGDPADAVDAWLAEHGDEWVNNQAIEDLYPVTQFPGGWLLRAAPPSQDTPGLGGVPSLAIPTRPAS